MACSGVCLRCWGYCVASRIVFRETTKKHDALLHKVNDGRVKLKMQFTDVIVQHTRTPPQGVETQIAVLACLCDHRLS